MPNDVSAAQSLPMFVDGGQDAEPVDAGRPMPAEDADDGLAPEPDSRAHEAFARTLLALGRVRGIGVRTLRFLLDQYGSLERVWHDDTPSIRDVLARAKVADSRAVAAQITGNRDRLLEDGQRQAEALAKRGIRIISREELWFPPQFSGLPDMPYWLFVQGDPTTMDGPPLVAVVGTRDATAAGRTAASRLTTEIVHEGVGIVSGLAEGIDAIAHQTAASYRARQVAVLGTGVNSDFPSSTVGLRRRIVDAGGAIVTEYMPDDTYGKAKFVQRNRIQAALAAAVCVVEGRTQSGTAHTLRFARAYGRLTFGVVCGRPSDDNELLGMLRGEGSPVYDLGTDVGLWELQQMLQGLPGQRWPKAAEADPSMAFKNVLRELDELESDLGVTPMMARWLLRHIAQRYRFSTRGLD